MGLGMVLAMDTIKHCLQTRDTDLCEASHACREVLMRSAAGPEVFLAMRANFVASLAAVCITNYVAGRRREEKQPRHRIHALWLL